MTDGIATGVPQRLDPRTLALAIPRLGPQMVQSIPAILGIGVVGRWEWIIPGILLIAFINLGFSWLRWLRFEWVVDDDDVTIRSGVLSRNQRTIPFDRIQDVNIEQGLFARLLGLAKVGFETGGGTEKGKDDASLDAIALPLAAALRDHIRSHRLSPAQAAAPAADGTTSPLPAMADEQPLFAMTPARLLIAGFFNFSLAVFAVLFGLLQTFDDVLPINPFKPELWIDLATRYGLDQWVLAHRWLSVVAGALAVLLLGIGTGVARMILANWGFQLTRNARGFRRTRGLTTRTDVVIPAARVQAAVVETGFIRRRFGWYALKLQSLASDGKDERDHLVAPLARLKEIDAILGELGLERHGLEEGSQGWQPVHASTVIGSIIVAVMVAALALAPLVLGPISDWPPEVLRATPLISIGLLALGLLLLLMALVDWRHRRWRLTGGLLHIARGAFSRTHIILPARHIQSADIGIGPVTRRFDTAALRLGVPGGAAGQHQIAAIAEPVARQLRQQLLAAT